MNTVEQSVRHVAQYFEYTSDKKIGVDHWSVMEPIDGKMRGDCDDFAVTCMWFIFGQSLLSFVWNVLITRKGKLVHVRTTTGGGHLVGNVGELWFDNWTLAPLPKDQFFAATGHSVKFEYNFFTMWLPLLIGTFFKK